MSDWCAEHKREKPCPICRLLAQGTRKLMELSTDERAALFRSAPPHGQSRKEGEPS